MIFVIYGEERLLMDQRLEKLKKEYQSQYADIESKYKDFHGRDDRSAKELMDLTVAFRKRIKTIRDKYNV